MYILCHTLVDTPHFANCWSHQIKSRQENEGKKMLSTPYFHAPMFLPRSFSTIRVSIIPCSVGELNYLFPSILFKQTKPLLRAEQSGASNFLTTIYVPGVH